MLNNITLCMGSVKRKTEKIYLKLPKGVRGLTDPIVKNRGSILTHLSNRAEKGEKIVRKRGKKLFYNPTV